MTQIEKFIAKKCLLVYLAVLGGLLGAIWLVRVLNVLDFYLNVGASGGEVIRFSIFLIPNVFANVAAPSLLIALLIVYSGLLSSREYFVLTGAGVSPVFLFRPILIISLVVTLILGVMSFYLAPLAAQTLRIERDALQSRLSFGLLRAGVFSDLGRNVTVYAARKDEMGRVFDVLIFDDRNADQETVYTAKRGEIFVTQGDDALILEEGRIDSRERETGRQRTVYFERYQFPVSLQSGSSFNLAHLSPSQLMFHQLLNPKKLGVMTDARILLFQKRIYELIGELFTPLVFAFISLACVTGGALNRTGYSLRIFSASIAGIIFYGGVVMISSRIAEDDWPSMAALAFPLLTAFACALFFTWRNKIFARPIIKSYTAS